jgi:Uma2 family endonuclease
MIARHHPVEYSYADYLALDATSNVKLEYLDGQIYAMAGGTPEHAMLIRSVSTHLATQLRDTECRVSVTELRIRVLATGLGTYPDVAVICGRWERDPDDPTAVINPCSIVEVLSPSTEKYDRGEKFEHYQQIPSLREYMLIAHDSRSIELFERGEDGLWARTLSRSGEHARIARLGCVLDVDAVYDDAMEPT